MSILALFYDFRFSEVDLMRHKKVTFVSIFDVILQDSAKKVTFFLI